MDNERIWLLLARKFSKEATADELKELEALFKANPSLLYAYTLIGELKEPRDGSHDLLSEKEEEMMAEGLARIELSLKKSSQVKKSKISPVYKRRKVWLIAASVAILIGAGWYFYMVNHSEIKGVSKNKALSAVSDTAQVYVAAKASLIELQDGTKVWLNRGSTLRCSNTFNLKNRKVTLIGEAFFDVAKKADLPFIVHLKKEIQVKVLGTKFNIKAYPNTPIIEAALVSGKIALEMGSSDGHSIILKPHEKMTLNLDSINVISQNSATNKKVYQIAKMVPNPVDQRTSETAWINGHLSFYDMPFQELAYELERMFGKRIVFKDPKLKSYHLTGSFKGEQLKQILHALQITTPFQYKITGKKVILYHKP